MAAALAPYVSKRFMVRRKYKGKMRVAWVRGDGTINLNGTIRTSPSSAGRAATSRANDGWRFWYFRNADGDRAKLDELRTER